MFKLKDIPLFSSLDDKQLTQLQSDVHIHQYDKGSIVFYEGDQSEYLYILLEGDVRLYKTSPKGKQIHMHNFLAPAAIAISVACEKIPFPATCELLTDGYIGLLPLEKFDVCLNNVDFSSAMVKALGQRMQLVSNLLHKETVYSSEAKIADILNSNPSIFKRLKNTEIAGMLNITPETLSRVLTKLKKENIIRIDSHEVTIMNTDALQKIIHTNGIESKF
ncbi:MAG: transcriptional regulator, Crp/Fnr family [uncultured Sulfurovum sp.]|uniref:Transcriptional regulator, Crp/Fnr family n=1 Tax=uncultured Sulfurovum sp. TaxID=269237 RepID=A0A6S6TTL4_9BACT|nr:MAG: transcriptional regulator, Crp/Fnr family [uncultured Sulfurovum sp.]